MGTEELFNAANFICTTFEECVCYTSSVRQVINATQIKALPTGWAASKRMAAAISKSKRKTHYPKYFDNVCSKLFLSQAQNNFRIVVRRALGLYKLHVQQTLLEI